MKHCCFDNITIQGYSHILNAKECQDSSVCWDGKDYCAAIVCDGHGGEKYIRSRIGSDFACQAGKACIEKFMCKPDFSEKSLRQLELSIIQLWNEGVRRDYEKYPLEDEALWALLSEEDKKSLLKSPTKAYGTTFIAAMYHKDVCVVLKLGDGNANILYSDGSIEMPQELADDQLQFNLTTSLCSSRADMDFKHCVKTDEGERQIAGVVLTTDGVINCYPSERAYFDFIRNVGSGYLDDPKEKAHSELEECLHILSEKGSGDDLSVAVIVGLKR